MKKILILTVALLMITGVAYGATIVGSAHDLRGVGGGTTTQVCVFCHTPHNASAAIPVVLWNHAPTTATYTIYASATLKGTVSQPSGVSKACLSCHDGSIAVNSLVNAPADGTAGTASLMTGAARLGTNLQAHHPVSVTYRADLNNTLRTVTGSNVVNGGVTLPLFGTAAPFAVECGSCHNVHDPVNTPFLRVNNTGSQMCIACHIK